MANEDGDSLDWHSRSRTIIPLDESFRYPKSLQRVLNQERFSVAINRDFDAVVASCADRESTWISPQLQEIYKALHQAGWAYSFETWQGDRALLAASWALPSAGPSSANPCSFTSRKDPK